MYGVKFSRTRLRFREKITLKILYIQDTYVRVLTVSVELTNPSVRVCIYKHEQCRCEHKYKHEQYRCYYVLTVDT